MAIDEDLLAQLKETKAQIDVLQERLKAIVAELREKGASAEEIAGALRG